VAGNDRCRAYVGIGSNLADPVAQVRRAMTELDAVPGTRCVARSSLYRSAPVGKLDQPDFVNAVVQLETSQRADALLERLQALEAVHGRARGERNGPRTLDLDLLLYERLVLDTPSLVLPHPRMHERAFVLLPLGEIDPALEIPGRGRVSRLMRQVAGQQVERLED
jgi:2-amino-4-hydroxy-6-hydroxymethyldihydropteridine diphosphokinase